MARRRRYCSACGSNHLVVKPNRARCRNNQCKFYEFDRPLSDFPWEGERRVRQVLEVTERIHKVVPRIIVDGGFFKSHRAKARSAARPKPAIERSWNWNEFWSSVSVSFVYSTGFGLIFFWFLFGSKWW